MLLALRDRLSGFIAWIIVILITIPFMLWGIQEYVGLGQDGYVAKVNGEEISPNEYDRMLGQNRQQLLESFGGQIPSYFNAQEYLQTQTLNQLISRELLRQMIAEYGYRVPDALLKQEITGNPTFQVDGQFDAKRYRAALDSRGMSVSEYEAQLARQILNEQIQNGIQKTAFVAKSELVELARLKYQTRSFDYLVLPYSAYEKKIEVADDEIQEYYDSRKSSLKTQEKVRLKYIELKLSDLADKVAVSEDLLRDLYQQGLDSGRYKSQEVRNARHILIRIPDDADPSTVEAKREKINALHKKIEQGADFAELAKQESDDPGSASQGGSLGDVSRGAMVKPFEEVLFALEEDELSDPVRTRFGFHIIRVDDIKPGRAQPFEEVKQTIERDYRRKQAESEFFDYVNDLETLSFENPGALAPVAENLGLTLEQSDWISRSGAQEGEGIAQYPEVRQTAFSDPVLEQRQNSELIEVGSNHVVVLRVDEYQPSRPQTLEEARDEIVDRLRRQKAAQAIEAAAGEVLQKAQAGASLEQLAGQYPGEHEFADGIRRDNSEIANGIVQAAFRIPAPEQGGSSLEKATIRNNDVAVVRLNKVRSGDIAWLEDKERQQFEEQIETGRGTYDFQALLKHLRESAEVEIHPDLQPEEREGRTIRLGPGA